jgi:hypothetical protein
MGIQYSCKNQLRRALVLKAGTLNGIDFLEVLDDEAIPLGSPRQQTLIVHFLQPNPPLTVANFEIQGGVRITPVNCVWAFPANAVPATVANPAEIAYFNALPDVTKVIVIRTAVAGDFSTYTIQLVTSPDDSTPPAGFDPRLSSVDFSFKVECPSDFDCDTPTVCPPQTLSAPPIDYLAKDYASFRQLMLDRLAVTMPAWQERSAADVGITIVEVLAYAADHLSYYQDAVATEAYLGTARKRVSVRRHAKLLDYQMHDGCNARAWVFIDVNNTVNGVPLPGPTGPASPGTALVTQTTFPTGVITTDQETQALRQGALVFQTMQDVVLQFGNREMHFYTWSDDQCCLPKGATEATLRNDNVAFPIRISAGDPILFEEVISPATGAAADADPNHRCVVRLTSVTPGTDPLDGTPIIEIEWAAEDALPFPLCISAMVNQGGGSTVVGDLSVARGNILLADQGQTIPAEPLAPPSVPAPSPYRPQLQNLGITFCAPLDNTLPASEVSTQDPRAALPAISLNNSAGNDLWLPKLDLLESSRFAHEFVVETEDDGTATLRFGDGELGALPDANLSATYRIGSGSAGNVGAGAIFNVLTGVTGIVAVRNPLPASGGIDPETIQQVQAYAPQAFRTQERAVTEADYATISELYPQVQKAQGTLRWTGSWYTMFVTVEREGGQPVDENFRSGLLAYLDSFRLAGIDLEVEPPVFVPLDIAFTVCVSPSYLRSTVEQGLYDTFSNRVLPNGQLGFFHPDNFTFGQPVYLSRIIAAAMQIPGVHWVDTDDTPPKPNHFLRWGQASNGETQKGEIDFARLEIARLDNDPNNPENGKIEFFMEGGL